MKKFQIITYLWLLSIIMFFGCNKEEIFLNEAPSAVSTESFFKTSADFEALATACYAYMRPCYSGNYMGSVLLMGEIRSDNTTIEVCNYNEGLDEFYDIDKFVETPANGQLPAVWNNLYQCIGRCNNAIYYIDLKGAGFEGVNQYRAETEFIRALMYYNLVLYWGDVPLVTTKVNSMEQAFALDTRVSKNLVFDQMIADLTDAKANLPENYDAANVGRVTADAARVLYAEVLMWQEKYTEAATELKAVMAGGRHSLLNDYASVFSINNEMNAEIIFACQYIAGPYGQSSNHMYTFSPSMAGLDILPFGQETEVAGMNIPTTSLIRSFEKGDKRLCMIDTTFVNKNLGDDYEDTIVPYTKKYWDYNATQREICGSDVPILRYPHVLLMLAECYLVAGGGDPVPLVNMVRERAGLPALSTITLDDIIHERRVEFNVENDRWPVLVRTGKALAVMTAHGIEQKQQRKSFVSPAYDRINLLFPIPMDAMSINPKLTQNPGY